MTIVNFRRIMVIQFSKRRAAARFSRFMRGLIKIKTGEAVVMLAGLPYHPEHSRSRHVKTLATLLISIALVGNANGQQGPKPKYEPFAKVVAYGAGTITAQNFMVWLGELSPPELFDQIASADRQWLIQADINIGARGRTPQGDDFCLVNVFVRLWPMKDPFGGTPLGNNIDKWPAYGPGGHPNSRTCGRVKLPHPEYL